MAVVDSGYGPWNPLAPAEAAALFADLRAPWWIAGGYAIDAFVGELDRRPHGDIDVGILARDQAAARACVAAWDLHCADPPGTLRPWLPGEALEEPVHDVWARPSPGAPWMLQFVLNTDEPGIWVYRRDPRIRRAVEEIVWHSDGVPYLVPEVQLLFKSKDVRPKDEQDFSDSLPVLSSSQRSWLATQLELTSPGHRWLERL